MRSPMIAIAALALATASDDARAGDPDTMVGRAATPFPPSVRELNGVWLGEPLAEIESRLGRPFREIEGKEGSRERIYVLDASSNSYMAIGFAPFRPANAIAVQVNSDGLLSIPGLHGLKLGADWNEVVSTLGKPSGTQDVEGLGRMLLRYEGRNYSLEMDSNSRLVSVRISGYRGVASGEGWSANWEEYMPYSLEQAYANLESGASDTWRIVPPGAVRIRPLVRRLGGERAISDAERKLLELSFRTVGGSGLTSGSYDTAVTVKEGDREWWVILQNGLSDAFRQEVKTDQWVELFVILMGVLPGGETPVFAVNEFSASPFPGLAARRTPVGLNSGVRDQPAD